MFNDSKSRVVTVGIRAVFLSPYLTLRHKVDYSNSSKFVYFLYFAIFIIITNGVDLMARTRVEQIEDDR